ncbi:MAG: hypothetical protein MZW92_79275 [Comamonadaceae bacterium]|nr:hypothetical protein [Comamonadaceae bacterium]
MLTEIDRSLHGPRTDQDQASTATSASTRDAWLEQICDALDAAPVQHIGNILVIYRAGRQNPSSPLPG